MENFVVSARKYRPAMFETVVGQELVVKTLKNAIKNHHLAHAFLFCGPRGVGKTTSARLLAKTINCTNISENIEACNQCESCVAFNKNANFNIYELDAASNNSVDDIRALAEQVRYAPQGGRYKIYIIDEVHMLSPQAFNAFLKTLEEPPPYAKFILATTEKHKILPTILSRCQIFDFHRIGINDAVNQLKIICKNESITADDDALHTIAIKADGAMRDALSIFDRIVSFSGNNITYNDVILNLNVLDYEYYFKAINFLLSNNMPGILLLFDNILTNGFDAHHFLNGFAEHLRNLMICKFPDTVKLLEVTNTVANKYNQQAEACSAAFLLNALNIINQCELNYKQSNNQRLHVELALLKLSNLNSVIQLNTQQPQVDEKKKTDSLTGVGSSQKQTEPVFNKTTNPATALNSPVKPVAELIAAVADATENTPSGKLEKLKQKIAQQILNGQNANTAEDTPHTITLAEDSFSKESFTETLNAFLNYLDNNKKTRISSFLGKAAILLNENDFIITVELKSKLELELLQEERVEMTQFFRQKLNNKRIDFNYIINENLLDTTKTFTKSEQLKLVTDRYPDVAGFVQSLGLEIDY